MFFLVYLWNSLKRYYSARDDEDEDDSDDEDMDDSKRKKRTYAAEISSLLAGTTHQSYQMSDSHITWTAGKMMFSGAVDKGRAAWR